MSFKIYFAGSMRAGRDDAPLYKLIVEHLKKHGTVLSEWTAYDRNEDGMDDKEIYERDMAALSTADVLVAEVSMPSLGVGYEIARASLANKPVLCLFRPSSGRKLSAMIQGAENEKSFRVVHYKDNEYVATIDDFFNSLKS